MLSLKNSRTFFVFISITLLSSCASISDTIPVIDNQHQQQLKNIEDWEIQGRLNIRTTEDSQTVNLYWQQSKQEFDINLSGSLGVGTVIIKGNANAVVLEKSGEEPYYASDLQEASIEWLGYPLPAQHLLYWIRGLNAPDSFYTEERNERGLLATLTQEGWQLEYDRYEQFSDIYLPGRIRMQNPDYRLTFLISRWTLSTNE